MKKRIYVVTDMEAGTEHLVKAPTRGAARGAVTIDRFKVDVASQDKIVELVSNGEKVIEAVAETEESGD